MLDATNKKGENDYTHAHSNAMSFTEWLEFSTALTADDMPNGEDAAIILYGVLAYINDTQYIPDYFRKLTIDQLRLIHAQAMTFTVGLNVEIRVREKYDNE